MDVQLNGVEPTPEIAELTQEIAHYQSLVESAVREINAGNRRMQPLLEGYANHRDSLMVQKQTLLARRGA